MTAMTNKDRQAAMKAHRDAREAARAQGGLWEAIRRCKRGSPKYADYMRRIDEFQRKEHEATDTLEGILIIAAAGAGRVRDAGT